jgi:two-component system, cell cycle response regulator DivK
MVSLMVELPPRPDNNYSSPQAPSRQTLRILVVEDDPFNASIFDKILKKLGGFEVCLSEDVHQILAVVKTAQADLVIMDVSLSRTEYQGKKINGLQLTKMIKAIKDDFPVLLVTAHAMKGDMERFLQESGADGYLAKPILEPAELIAQVLNLGKRIING